MGLPQLRKQAWDSAVGASGQVLVALRPCQAMRHYARLCRLCSGRPTALQPATATAAAALPTAPTHLPFPSTRKSLPPVGCVIMREMAARAPSSAPVRLVSTMDDSSAGEVLATVDLTG